MLPTAADLRRKLLLGEPGAFPEFAKSIGHHGSFANSATFGSAKVAILRLTAYGQCGEYRRMHLKQHLANSGESVASFAARVGVDVATMYRYIAGTRFPTRANLRAIRQATGGAVTADDFVDLPETSSAERGAA